MKTFGTLCRLRQHSIQIKGILAVLICCSLSSLQAQDFDNTGGTFRNGGFFGVRQQVTGLPDSIGGTFNYFGTNQQVPAILYQNLILSGSGTKTTVGGDFMVLGNLTDSSLVILNIQSGILTLGGTLFEQGYVQGKIQKSVILEPATGTSDFGQIGSVISWMNRPLGTTLLIRSSGTASTVNGYQSIRRYYDVMPTVNNRLTATLVFKYSANELNSHNPPTLELWRSTNNGTSWRRQGGVVDTANKTITKTGIVQFSRWTASDTSHLLGPAAYEWMPDSLLYVAGDTQKTYRHKSLQQPLVIRLKDYFNNWLEGDTVDFGFAGNSKGATLSILKAIADSNGYASTTLTLGDSLGVYTVVASNSKIPGRTIRFNATAIQSRVAVAIQLTAGNSQPPTPIYTSLSPFVVTTVDSEALPTSDDTVYFSIVSTPLNATGQSLSDTMVITDTIGQASTILKLGNKVGTYMIRATSRRGLIGSPITFTARAISGPPTTATLVSGNNQVKLVGDTLINPLVLSVADTGQNPVDSVYVKFAVASVPTGAQNYRLIADSVKTDSLGRASVRFILGTKPGFYTITARVANLTPMVFTARGFLPAVAIQLTAGNNQPATPILTSLSPFVVTAVDSEANPTIDDTVYFSIVSTPPNATGQSLSDTMVITDTIRQASTILRLGNKVGTYTIRATSRGLIGSPITFTARAIPGQPTTTALVSGNNQVKQIGDTLTNPLVLSVADTGGNQVDSALVKFAIASAPTGAQNHHLSADSVMTDSLGRASVQFILGTKPGFYTITATVANLTPMIFTERGFLLKGDANGDESYNVADITTLIDHINGKKPLIGIDSLRADVNNDSVIDAKDIAFIRNNILNEVINSDSGSNGPSPRYHRGPELKVSIPQIDEEPTKETSTLETQSVNGTLEVTVNGLRFNLTNDIPVTGLQLDARFEQNINIEAPELIFDRMRNMEVYIHSIGSRMHVIAYNLKNEPIDTGQGTLFRIPLFLSSTAQIDTIEVVLSTLDNNAISFPATISRAVPGLTYPAYYKLYQNYPNPFNHGTIILYDVPDIQGRFAKILIQVFDILGREVKTLYLGEKEAGFRKMIPWDGTDNSGKQMSSGIYFYRLISREHMSVKKMIILK